MGLFARLLGRKRDTGNRAQAPITGNFNLTAQLAGSSGRSIAIAGYIYDGESYESLTGRLDVLNDLIDRERARSEIPELEAKREQMVRGMAQAREVLAEMEGKQKRGESLSSQERTNMKNLAVNIAKMNEEIGKGAEAIVEAKKKAGVAG